MKDFIRKTLDKAGITLYRNHLLPVGTDYRKTLRTLHGTAGMRTVLDIGANVGQFCTACNEILDQSKIYAFEPVLTTFATLQKNTAKIKNIECSTLGFGDRPQTVEMYLQDLSTVNSINPASNKRRSENQKSQSMEIVTVDDFCTERNISQIDLLKIDVEGFDLNVLMGAKRMLTERKVTYIFIEVTFDNSDAYHRSYQEISTYLEQFGFKIFGFYNQNVFHGSPYMNYCDALFRLQPIER